MFRAETFGFAAIGMLFLALWKMIDIGIWIATKVQITVKP